MMGENDVGRRSMAQVSIVSCPSYDAAVCREALLQVLEPVGGLDFVKPGMRVGIKANLVSFLKPEAGATTHPVLLAELTKLLRERGASSVVIGDSPGGLYTAAYAKNVYRAAGMHQAEEAGAELNMDFSQKEADNPAGMVAKHFTYTGWLDGCDAIIDFCKLKSHGMMAMTCAAKNMFGVIPGTLKPEYHYKYPNAADFARMIVDLDEYFKPVLSIADAVVGMDGNGPTMGKAKPMGFLAASPSPHALDLVCARLIGLRREDVPTLEAACERGLVPAEWKDLDISGDVDAFFVEDFDRIAQKNDVVFFGDMLLGKGNNPFKKALATVMQKALRSRPDPAAEECVGCGQCEKICPAKAIVMRDKLPRIDRGKCIRCFCCQEFCPKGAMKVVRPVIARVLNR